MAKKKNRKRELNILDHGVKKAEQSLKLFLLKDEVQDYFRKLRTKCEMPPDGLNSKVELNRWLKIPNKKHSHIEAVYRFMKKYDFSRYYEQAFLQFFYYNDITKVILPQGNANLLRLPPTQFDKILGPKYAIEFYPETTLDDLQRLYLQVKSSQKGQLGYKRAKRIDPDHKVNRRTKFKPSLDRDIYVYHLHMNGYSQKEIKELVDNSFPDQKITTPTYVSTIVKRLKNRIKEA